MLIWVGPPPLMSYLTSMRTQRSNHPMPEHRSCPKPCRTSSLPDTSCHWDGCSHFYLWRPVVTGTSCWILALLTSTVCARPLCVLSACDSFGSLGRFPRISLALWKDTHVCKWLSSGMLSCPWHMWQRKVHVRTLQEHSNLQVKERGIGKNQT